MSAILITDPVKLREAIEFAMEAGCTDELARGLLRLMHTASIGMTKDNNRVTTIVSDFAPHSMGFAIFDNAKVEFSRTAQTALVMNGGWIYAGPGAPGDGSFPSLSVNLDYVTGQAPRHSWSVHT